MPTVVGVLRDREQAEQAIPDMVGAGVDRDSIGIMWRDKTVNQPEEIKVATYHDHHEDAASEAGKGAVGGAIGGATTGAGTMLLAAGGLALLPGIGAVLAAGTLAATAAAAAAGAIGGGVTGGLLGALIGASDSDATKEVDTTTLYRDAIEREGYLVSVDTDTDGQARDVSGIMEEVGATDVSILSDRVS